MALQGFSHPAIARTHLWDTAKMHFLRPFAQFIAEPAHRSMVLQVQQFFFATRINTYFTSQVIDRFEAEFVPLAPSLPTGLIHNDGNDHNIVMDDQLRVAGIIDLGDMTCSPYVVELAVAITYGSLFKTAHPVTRRSAAGQDGAGGVGQCDARGIRRGGAAVGGRAQRGAPAGVCADGAVGDHVRVLVFMQPGQYISARHVPAGLGAACRAPRPAARQRCCVQRPVTVVVS